MSDYCILIIELKLYGFLLKYCCVKYSFWRWKITIFYYIYEKNKWRSRSWIRRLSRSVSRSSRGLKVTGKYVSRYTLHILYSFIVFVEVDSIKCDHIGWTNIVLVMVNTNHIWDDSCTQFLIFCCRKIGAGRRVLIPEWEGSLKE